MNELNIENRTIYCHDNLEVMQGINSTCIDLIYLDPPFNKKKTFTAPLETSAEGASFKDIFKEEDLKSEWVKTIEEDNHRLHDLLTGVRSFGGRYNYCYCVYMAIRLIEIHRILKDTGSVYLHCDPTMSHYLKLVMDCIFGEKNFRNEIIWQRNDKRGKGSQHSSKKYGANTDTILFYTKSNNFILRNTLELSKEEAYKKFYKMDDKGRRYYTGIPIFCSKNMGARPNLCYEWRGFKNPHPSGWRLEKKKLEEEYQKGNVVIRGSSIERRKYMEDYEGKPIDNNWVDISREIGKERTGYPTQKPLMLMERIIKASSNEGDVVLDPFCGCATTCVAAEKLDRRWIGVDVSHKAYELVKKRLQRLEEEGGIENLFNLNQLRFYTDPPKRTDDGKDHVKKKWVYVISIPQSEGLYKVGITSNMKNRLGSFHTAVPDNLRHKVVFSLEKENYRETERHIHTKYENVGGEWVKGDLQDIIRDIKKYDAKSKGQMDLIEK